MKCRICAHADGLRRHRAREMFFGLRDEFDYFECPACGCVQIAAVPDDLGRYYGGDYYSLAHSRRAPPPPSRLRRARDRLFLLDRSPVGRAAAATLRRLSPQAHTSRLMPVTRDAGIARFDDPLLDVGCGAGDFLFALAARGFTALEGCDPFIAAPVRAGPVTLHRAALDALPSTPRYRLVLFQHSLEHLPDQVGALVAARERLLPGGRIFVEVPVVDSYAWRTYGTDWVDLDAPRHLYLHSIRSITRVAAAAGLAIARIAPMSSVFELLASEQYRRGIPLRAPDSIAIRGVGALYTPAALAPWQRLARRLDVAGEAGRLAFYLRHAGLAQAGAPGRDARRPAVHE
jgi:SAM-dependent methyltransferase